MKDLKEIKQTVVPYGMHSPYVGGLIKTWTSNNKATLHDWLQLLSVMLEDRSVTVKVLLQRGG